MRPGTGDTHSRPILRPGETCWQLAHAERVSFIIDAADYFKAAKAAISKAQSSVYLIGWDFDLRIRLRPDVEHTEQPDELRSFLTDIVEQRPDLRIYILQWDGAMIVNVLRQVVPFALLRVGRKEQLRFRLDSKHPAGACHHQKIVVVDDAMAFCGGIDITSGRWDTPAHRAADRARKDPDGTPMRPWHDVTMAVDGPAARQLGELARDRWHRATGERLPAPEITQDIWPDNLPVSCSATDVAIARTMPEYTGQSETIEIENLWLAAIGAARRSIYIENQYLASSAISRALLRRLAEPHGPEVVIVLPDSADGWVEEKVMDSARAEYLEELRDTDKHGRFAAYYPVNDAGESIYVHAKALIIDNRLVRIGSSNMSNRSMRLDSECDLALEATGNESGVAQAIARFRDTLIAEHLGLSPDAFAHQLERHGQALIETIEAVRKRLPNPTLRPLPVEELTDAEKSVAQTELLNPEQPDQSGKRVARFFKNLARQSALGVLASRARRQTARLTAFLGVRARPSHR